MPDTPTQELRIDALTGAHVIVAPSRATRPGDAVRVDLVPRDPAPPTCPFCPGNESMTPPEVARLGRGAADTPGWRVRIVPNLYPIVGAGVDGAHEVVIMSPSHTDDFGALDDATAIDTMSALRDRAHHHLESGLVHAQPFVNHGRTAGASIPHPHAQLVSLGVVPPRVDALLERFASARRDLVAAAIDDAKDRSLLLGDGAGAAVSWCPPASWSPFLVRCALPEAGPRFDEADDAAIADSALAVRDAIARIQRVLGDLAYNLVVQSAPRDDRRPFHWWVDVIPRVTVLAGFELATGMFVNVVPAEVAAAALGDGP
jgi:UDPglucose--hexose-1-phosphate uridylyltransferase